MYGCNCTAITATYLRHRCDMETAAEAAELSHKFGYTMVPSFTASKILWLQRHEPEVYERLAMVMLPHDYVNYWLTGRCAAVVSSI